MPYRGQPEPGARCFRHDAAPAVASCRKCLNAICDVCLVYDATLPHCPSCARSVRRMRAIGRAATLVSVLAVVGGGVTWLALRKGAFDHGTHAPKIRELRGKLEQASCHRQTALELAEQLLGAGDAQGTIAHIDGFLKKCGDWHRLRWARYSAHKQQSQWLLAVEDATQLIADRPDDQDFWWWRGQMYEQAGKHEEAISDYRQAHALLPKGNYIPFDLSKLLEAQSRPCEALAPVEVYLYHHEDHRKGAYVESRLEKLGGLCPDFYGEGGTILKLDDEGRARERKAELNGERADVSIDSGLSFSQITQAAAARLKVDASKGQELSVSGRKGRFAILESVKVGRASARRVEVMVVDTLPLGADAILGQTFLARFVTADDGVQLLLDARER
jgi:tetratricopeptide (TPR) repeat protein